MEHESRADAWRAIAEALYELLDTQDREVYQSDTVEDFYALRATEDRSFV